MKRGNGFLSSFFTTTILKVSFSWLRHLVNKPTTIPLLFSSKKSELGHLVPPNPPSRPSRTFPIEIKEEKDHKQEEEVEESREVPWSAAW